MVRDGGVVSRGAAWWCSDAQRHLHGLVKSRKWSHTHARKHTRFSMSLSHVSTREVEKGSNKVSSEGFPWWLVVVVVKYLQMGGEGRSLRDGGWKG
ncbi:hypothetical protein E2C01_007353 [Portunus trituberculatus]|uniref:Uncharacterized protein n=1 Tax=Portunus trituberculatus TaxID=210409 RepID=A0A5B7CZY8_PORTR|nr:hypothetical protein [Portunus trituberculatus]